jgi:hypothetical protein
MRGYNTVMNKRRIHHSWTRFKHLKPWYFLAIAIISTTVCVLALRANNEHMIKLREAVYSTDKDNGDVAGALTKLQAYVTTHMNTNLSTGPNAVYPPIQLKYTYDRLVQDQSAQTGAASSQLYTDAQHYCESLNSTDFSGRNRVPCIQQYVQSHTASKVASIPDALYKFSFQSPTWSPDLAGWSLLIAAISWLMFAVVLVAGFWLKHQSK